MGLFTSRFEAVKKKTPPYKALPKSVQEALDVASIQKDGRFQIGAPAKEGAMATYDRCYEFRDINYAGQDLPEQKRICLQFCKVLSAMRRDFKIVTANEPQDEEEFRAGLLRAPAEGRYPELAAHTRDILGKFMEKGKPGIRKRHYLVVTCQAKGWERAVQYFNSLELTIAPLFESMGTILTPMDAMGRLDSIHRFFCGAAPFRLAWEDIGGHGRDWRNDVISPHIENHRRYLRFADHCVQILFAYHLPTQLDEERTVHELTDFPFPVWLTLDSAYIPRDVLVKQLETVNFSSDIAISNEQAAASRQGVIRAKGSPRREKLKKKTSDYVEQIAANDENGFFTGILLAVSGRDEAEMEENVDMVRIKARELIIDLAVMEDEQLQAMNTVLPTGARRTDHMRPLLTTSYVAFQPFHSFDLLQRGGFCYGVNKRTGNPIVGDKKTLGNQNKAIIGPTGSGKSMFEKVTEIGQTLLYTEDDIIMIDPQNEYVPLIESGLVDGEFFDMSPGSGVCANPLEAPEEVLYATDPGVKKQFVQGQADFMVAFMYSILMGALPTGIHKSITIRCVEQVYRDAFAEKDPVSPTLSDLYRALREQPEPAAEDLYGALEGYTQYGMKTLAGQSTFDIRKRFVVFGLDGLSKSTWGPVMLTLAHIVAQRMKHNQAIGRATNFIVDEAQYVCGDPMSCGELENSFRTVRKKGGMVTICLQNTAAATSNLMIQNMVSNSDMKVFMSQSGIDRNEMRKIVDVSEEEFQMLGTHAVGQGLLVWGRQVIPFDCRISADNPLYKIFSTNFHEKAAERAREEGEGGRP